MSQWFESMFAGGAIPTLEKALEFSATRHRLVLDNIANADTPYYQRKDLDAAAFQEALEEAIGKGPRGARELRSIEMEELWSQERTDGPFRAGMLRHDQNNVDMEMELALLSRNGSFHNQMASLLRKSFQEIRMAIAERPI